MPDPALGTEDSADKFTSQEEMIEIKKKVNVKMASRTMEENEAGKGRKELQFLKSFQKTLGEKITFNQRLKEVRNHVSSICGERSPRLRDRDVLPAWLAWGQL